LLVYHFKQRLASLEEKGDTMFEIINNIVKEISSLKQAFVQRNTMFPAMVPMTHLSTAFTHPNPSMAVNMNTNEYSQLQNVNNHANDDEDEDDEEDEEDDDEDDEDDAVENIDAGNVVPEEHNIKIVKMEINEAEFDSVEEYEPEIDEQEPEPEIEEEADEDQDQEPEIEADEDQELEPEIEEEEADELEDDQDQEPELEEHDFDQEPEEPPAIDKESYRKMNLQQLKSMVVSKGLSKDANKLKKNELIALLEK
jgi:hypothetical protein